MACDKSIWCSFVCRLICSKVIISDVANINKKQIHCQIARPMTSKKTSKIEAVLNVVLLVQFSEKRKFRFKFRKTPRFLPHYFSHTFNTNILVPFCISHFVSLCYIFSFRTLLLKISAVSSHSSTYSYYFWH